MLRIGSKRAVSYVREFCIGVYSQPNDDRYDQEYRPSEGELYDLSHRMSVCLQALRHAESIHSIRLLVGVYEPNRYPSE